MEKYYFDHVLPSEVDFVSQITFSDSHLTYRPLTVLNRSQLAGNILACRNSRRVLIGWVEIYPLWGRDWGMSTLYIMPQWRKRGLAIRLLKMADQKLISKRVFTATNNPNIIKVLVTLGYRPINFLQIPKLTLMALLVTRYFYIGSWFKLLSSAGWGLRYFVR